MSAALTYDPWTEGMLSKLSYVEDHLISARAAYEGLVGEGDEVHDAIIAALAAIDIRAAEVKEGAAVVEIEHQLHELGADETDEEDAA